MQISVACNEKAVFLQSRFARHTNGAPVGRRAPKRGGSEEEKTGTCSLNEWNDVANTQEILLRDSSEKTRPGQTNKKKEIN